MGPPCQVDYRVGAFGRFLPSSVRTDVADDTPRATGNHRCRGPHRGDDFVLPLLDELPA